MSVGSCKEHLIKAYSRNLGYSGRDDTLIISIYMFCHLLIQYFSVSATYTWRGFFGNHSGARISFPFCIDCCIPNKL